MTLSQTPGGEALAAPDDDSLARHLRAMQQDPVANRTLMAWQDTAVNAILKAVDMLTQQLTARSVQPDESGEHYDIIQARGRARRRQSRVQQCRELAEEMVLASVCHLSDPDWDPFAPALEGRQDGHARAPADNVLMMLLDLAQPPR